MSLRDTRRAQSRADILAAAWDLCRESGLAGLSLRELAARVGMRAPSLYSYFGSKHAIYDAMYRQGYEQLADTERLLTATPLGRERLGQGARVFFDFCVADPVRYQLLFQRTIPGFEPSVESYALAVAQLEVGRRLLVENGYDDDRLLDLWTALLSGLTAQQIANDPGGDRWGRLLDAAVDMFVTHAESRLETLRSSP